MGSVGPCCFGPICLLLVGCFDPQLPSEVACADGLCPVGLVCDRGFCRADLSIDASPVPDVALDAGCSTLALQDGVDGYAGTEDTEIREGAPIDARGSEPDWTWDTSGTGMLSIVALLRFDGVFGSGADQIPLGATIESALLTIVVSGAGQTPPGRLHEILVDWDDGVTWDTFGSSPGIQGDIGPDLLDLPFDSGTHVIDVTDNLRAYSAGSPQLGWAFVPASSDGVDAESAEAVAVDTRPRLEVTVCPP